jgi:hypothetical protein
MLGVFPTRALQSARRHLGGLGSRSSAHMINSARRSGADVSLTEPIYLRYLHYRIYRLYGIYHLIHSIPLHGLHRNGLQDVPALVADTSIPHRRHHQGRHVPGWPSTSSFFARFRNLTSPPLFPPRVRYTLSGHNANMICNTSVCAPSHSATAHCEYSHCPAAEVTQTLFFVTDITSFRYTSVERIPPFQPIELSIQRKHVCRNKHA